MAEESRQFNYPSWSPTDKASAGKLNTLSNALQSISQGNRPGSQSPAVNLDYPTSCRLALTDASRALSGLGSLGGATLESGDYVLRATTSNADEKDGVYVAYLGAWQRIARLKYTPVENSVVLPHGTLISVWDGNTSPALYMASTSGATTF